MIAKNIEIELRFCDISKEAIPALLLADVCNGTCQASDAKHRALDKLGCPRYNASDRALTRWCKWMHEINGLEFSEPAHPAIRHAIEWTNGAMRFVFVLA